MSIIITRNAIERTMQITGLRENSVKKLITRSYVCGTDIRELQSCEKAYYKSQIDTEKRKAYVYAGCCFIFADNYCIHVMKNPAWSFHKSRFDGKIKVKDINKYD